MFTRALLAGLVATATALAVPVAPALAAPFVSIESPGSGTVTNETHPTVSGLTSDTEDPVKVIVLKEGALFESTQAEPKPNGAWSVVLANHLDDGEYTVEASQIETLTGESGGSGAVGFRVDTQSPEVTMSGVSSPTNDATPSFSGTATDPSEAVTVYVFRGSSPEGSLAAKVSANPSGGAWSTATVGPLADGTYTAIAEQPSSIGNKPGHSQPSTFEVHAAKPKVTLNGISSPTDNRRPSFSGTASEGSTVTVHIYAGGAAAGEPVAESQASGTGGSWSSGPASVALPDGSYTAVAEQESEFGDGPGGSGPIHFTVATAAPTVSMGAIPTPSNDTAPAFSGFASEDTPVVVHVYAGANSKGSLAAEAHASGTGGSWSSGAASPALGDGSYTAVAEQAGGFDNGTGHSGEVHFVVNTVAPALVLKPFKSPSNEQAPKFSGTTSDTTKVVVQVLEGSQPVASAVATPSGTKWETGPLSHELPAGEHTYTVLATQASSIPGNPEARVEAPYVLDTLPPAITITPIATPSKETKPSFSGTASDVGPVTFVVKLAGGKEVFKETVPVSAGDWAVPAGKITLPSTKATYTATATQASSLGNEAGVAKFTFVVDPLAPSVTLSPIKAQLGTPTPTFTGTASETTPVHVAICKLPTLECKAEPRELEAESVAGGAWSATLAHPLADGEYEAVAWQETLGGATGATAPQDFTVDTVAPVVAIQTPAQGVTVSGSTVSIHGTSGTAAHDVQAVTVQLFSGGSGSGGALQTVTVAAGGGGWSATLGGLAPGQYTVRASQADEAGNIGASEHSFTDAASASPVGGPVVGFSWFPSHPHTGEPVTLVSTSSDAISPITSYAWNVTGSAFVGGAQSRAITFTSAGSHLVRLRVTDGAGLSGVSSQQIPVSLPLMRPFPAVRIVTTRSGGQLHLKLLIVEAPAAATVTVACKGTGCPVRMLSRAVTRPKGKSTGLPVLTFPRLQRVLPAGVALEIRVTQPGRIGKYTRFAVRKGRLPLRSDACVRSTEPKAIPCA